MPSQENRSAKDFASTVERATSAGVARSVVRGCPSLSPREVHAEIFKPIFGLPANPREELKLQVAEAEGNRTPLTEVLGHNGFEDRAAHQDGYASSENGSILSVLLSPRITLLSCGSATQSESRPRLGEVARDATNRRSAPLSIMIAAIQAP